MAWAEVGLYHLTLVGRLHEQGTQNGFYFATKSTHTGPDHADNVRALGENFNTLILGHIQNFANNQWASIATIVATMIPRHGPIAEFPIETGGGIQPDGSLPSHNAAVLSLRSGTGGRSANGRSYYAGISEADSEDSKLTPDSFARLQNVGNQLIGIYGGEGVSTLFEYVLYSRKLGNIPAVPPDIGMVHTWAGVKPIVQTIARRNIASQRHRKLGRGM